MKKPKAPVIQESSQERLGRTIGTEQGALANQLHAKYTDNATRIALRDDTAITEAAAVGASSKADVPVGATPMARAAATADMVLDADRASTTARKGASISKLSNASNLARRAVGDSGATVDTTLRLAGAAQSAAATNANTRMQKTARRLAAVESAIGATMSFKDSQATQARMAELNRESLGAVRAQRSFFENQNNDRLLRSEAAEELYQLKRRSG